MAYCSLDFDWPFKSGVKIEDDAVQSFKKIDQYFTADQSIPYGEIEKAIGKIQEALNGSKCEEELSKGLPERMVSYLDRSREKPEKKLQLLEIAKIFGRTLFVTNMLDKLLLSVVRSPTPPTAEERVSLVSWLRFCEVFSEQMQPRVLETLKGLQKVLTIYTKEEIAAEPYLRTISNVTLQLQQPSATASLSAKHQEQLDFIEDFSAWFLRCYLLEPLCEETLSNSSISEITGRFKSYFSQMSQGLFLQEPRPIVAAEKKLIINLTRGTNRFLAKVHATLKKHRNINSPEFTQEFYKDGVYSREKILISIHKKLNRSLDILLLPKGEFQPPADKILVLLLTTALLNLIKCLIDPSVTPFIIEQMVVRTVPHFDDPPPQHNRDNQFATNLGQQLTELCKHLLQLGDGNGVIRVVLGGLNLWLRTNKRMMGSFMHEKFNSLTSRELILEPFRFMSTFLFAKDGDNKVPIFRHHLDQTSAQKQEYCANTKQSFLEQLHPTILKWVQKLNTPGANLMDNDATRSYCTSLGEKLWEMSQNSDLMLLLIDEILTGIDESIKE